MEISRFIKGKLDKNLEKDISNIFDILRLPMPNNRKEVLEATEGVLLFLEDYGCVLRIERSNNKEKISHPHLLNPFIEIELDNVRIGIYPGTKTNGSHKASLDLKGAFVNDGLFYGDSQSGNMGVIPIKNVDFPNGFPVVIDVPSVSRLSNSNKEIKSTIKNIQLEFYKEIYDVVKNLIDEKTNLPKKDKMDEFWNICKKNRKKGILISGWKQRHYEEKFKISTFLEDTAFRLIGFDFTKKEEARTASKNYSKNVREMHKKL